MRFVFVIVVCCASFPPSSVGAEDLDPRELVAQVVKTAGGEEKLLKLFRFRERLLITDTPAAPVTQSEKENRTSVVKVGGDWWVGKAKRDKDKVRVLCLAWSLRILLLRRSCPPPSCLRWAVRSGTRGMGNPRFAGATMSFPTRGSTRIRLGEVAPKPLREPWQGRKTPLRHRRARAYSPRPARPRGGGPG